MLVWQILFSKRFLFSQERLVHFSLETRTIYEENGASKLSLKKIEGKISSYSLNLFHGGIWVFKISIIIYPTFAISYICEYFCVGNLIFWFLWGRDQSQDSNGNKSYPYSRNSTHLCQWYYWENNAFWSKLILHESFTFLSLTLCAVLLSADWWSQKRT